MAQDILTTLRQVNRAVAILVGLLLLTGGGLFWGHRRNQRLCHGHQCRVGHGLYDA
jgi:LPXTG-motif cell wall-anchored protein